MRSIRKEQHLRGFEAKVALEAIKGEETSADLASKYGARPSEIRK